MELHISTGLHKFPYPSLHPHSPKRLFFTSHLFHGFNFPTRLKPNSRTLRFALCSEKDSSPNGSPFRENREEGGRSSREDSGFVEVIGIGSRKDAVLDFCLDSPSLWPSLRFWDIFFEDSLKVQLQQRYPGKDVTLGILEAPSVLLSCSKAIILVATAGYGADHIRAVDILKTVKSTNRLVVGIILKPFSFEGRRRQDEVKDLIQNLQDHTNFCIVVDADVLLEKELVTLDEALKTANTAVLMAINGLSILTSESQKKLLDSQHDNVKELNVSDIMKILDSYREAKIGFGAGHNMKTSIMRAVYDCPFLGVGLKDLDGVVICILSSSAVIDRSDVNAFLHTFRQTTECMGGIIISLVHEPNMEPNLIMATVLTIGHTRHQVSQESSIFSRLAQHFPFIVNLLRRNRPQSPEGEESYFPEDPSFSEANNTDSGEMQNEIPAHSTCEDFGIYSTELQTVLSNNGVETYYLRGFDSSFEKKDVEYSETTTDSSDFDDLNVGGVPAFQREPLIPRNLGPGFRISEEWTNQGANDCRAISTLDNLRIYKLPVGVKPSEELKNCLNLSNTIHHQEKSGKEDMMAQTQAPPRMSWDALTDAGFEAVSEFYDSASAIFKGTDTDVCKKQGVLSARASSMLLNQTITSMEWISWPGAIRQCRLSVRFLEWVKEAERESQQKWNPIVEISYRGGKYKGRCQGGLPEGKGRLSLRNGSIYEGMWRYGKRSGLGTFKFSNGDAFQGSWRDDVMHGKGWLYFCTGDRWFVNFWKGKANGEGRFYSKLGEIFFGHFKDGYRDGHFLCIDVDGSRYVENWDEGVLVSRKQLDTDADSI
ncbi:protein ACCUMULATION AND REPLICATION OF CHLOROPLASTS 3, chloroplastic isoform X4 [Rhododendron vialii]|uniref:protein ACCUMULATION AND REPLICATION OF CHLOROPLASTS 3, chloroplastic isoform X4 n=1 Tax=Rhododendron vialii TaxID=182163 RepID=UPI00265E97F1|nr:protein ACCUMULATION AND REPLICATION OF CHLOROPLASTS 3, chloroplastic isoform X4 [Rhododendron vialii]